MPTKRLSPSSDTSDVVELPLKKTHRTHEENQERAYIAASRRADRDIEHRIRSALKASECRRKRTGRGLKITREAVMGDEQYESEDDDHAVRRYSMPAATGLSSNNNNNQPYMQSSPNRAADRYAEVDALFAKHFPHIQLSSQWPRQQHHQPAHRHSYPQMPQRLQTTAAGGYVPRFQQQQKQQQQQQDTTVHVAVPTTGQPAVSATSASSSPPNLLTPPVSYPLPPVAASGCRGGEDENRSSKSRSMSPLALETGAHSRPGSTAPVGLGLLGGGYLSGGDIETMQGGEGEDNVPVHVDFSDPAWFTAGVAGDENVPTTSAGAGVGGGWHSRSLSLPSALEQFQFFSCSSSFGDPVAMGQESDSLIDPSILGSANDGVEVGPNEPWADWINLDGDVPAPLGIQV